MKRLIIFISIVLSCFFFMKQPAKCENESYTDNQVTADQLVINPDWIVTCDQQWTRYGDGISAGDLNGDGYDDVAVGAPAYEPGGAVLIYYGSVNGPQTMPGKILLGENIGFGNRVDCKGDVNNDGYNDLIVADPFFGGGRVFVYHGSPSGVPDTANSQQRLFYNGGNNFGYTVSSADFNGDGYSDLIASVRNEQYNSSLNIIAYIFAGSASGFNGYDLPDWIATVPINEFDVSNTIVSNAGDVNGDGFEDVIVGLNYSNKAFVYLGSLNRQFDAPADVILTDPVYEFGYSVSGNCDINSDGFDDILIGSRGGVAFAYYGSQNGPSLNFDWMKSGPDNCYGYVVKSAGDFNDDGFDDIAVSNCTDPIHLFFGSNAGLSDNSVELISPCYNLSNGDINGDGISDVLSSREPRAYGFYGSRNIFPVQITNVFPSQNAINVNKSSGITVEFGQDMNASTINSSNIKVFGSQTGLLSSSVSYNSGSRTTTINPNNDLKIGEKIQVTLTSGIQSSVNTAIDPFTWTFTVQALSGTGVFTEARIIDSTGSSSGDQITSGDFNGDGKLDIAQMNQSPEVFIYFNDGNANFNVAQIILKTFTASGGSIACGDFDNDYDMDLLISFVGVNDSIYIYKNNGSGFFSQSFAANYNSGYRRPPVINDFDSDGDIDIVSLTSNWDINLFINDGNGNLSHSYLLQDLDYVMGISSGDIDNDGDMDLITSVFFMNNSKSVLLINNGNASFTNGNIYYHNSGQDFCPNADFDSDGDIDFVTSKNIYFNIGNGNFSSIDFQVGSNGVSEILPADYDADNDIDNVYIDYFSDVKVFKNNGTGSFTNYQNLQPGYFPNFGISGDVDCDGDIDLIITNEGGHHWKSDISILLNDYNCPHPVFSISGNSSIVVGSVNNLYVSSAENGYWDIVNFENTQASIPANSTGDSVLVSAGNSFGHFELFFIATYDCGGDTILSKHVYIDNPLPVELSSINSSVSGRNVTLNWTTASELNNSGFEIEKRNAGNEKSENWIKTGFVNGSGTVSEPVNYKFTDKNLSTGKYKYRLKQIDFNGNFEYFELAEEVSIGIPDRFELSQNYPNPFNPVTTINYDLPKDGIVTLKIYDITGREVKTLVNEMKTAGYYRIQFNAADLSSGVYFYLLKVRDFVAVKKLVVLK